MRRLVTQAGYWPDIQQLLAAGGTEADLAREKAAILAAGRELIEVFGPAPWKERGAKKGNSIIISRLTIGPGSYALAEPIEYEPVNATDLSQGYTMLLLPDTPQDIRYEVRYVANDTHMDREASRLILTGFGVRRYLYGINDDLTNTATGFWVMPLGDSVDLSEDDFTERLWRVEVKDVQLIPGLPLEHVPAAVEMGLDLSIDGELAAEADVTPET